MNILNNSDALFSLQKNGVASFDHTISKILLK